MIDDEKTIASLEVFNRQIKIGIAEQISLQTKPLVGATSIISVSDEWIYDFWQKLL